MNTFVHSFWSKPAIKSERWGIGEQFQANIWMHALSAAYIRKAGFDIKMITDSEGYRVFSNLGIYSEVINVLDCMNHAHHAFWACGKIKAQQLMEIGDVHLDGDVFLKEKKLCEDILNFDGDLLVQNGESTWLGNEFNADIYYGQNLKFIRSHFADKDFPDCFDFALPMAFCCGIVAFKSEELKKMYVHEYFKMLDKMNSNADFLAAMEMPENKGVIPDIVFEQYYLACLAHAKRKKVCALLGNDWNEEANEEAKRIGYAHLMMGEKYAMIDTIKERLKDVNPVLYERVGFAVSRGGDLSR